MAETDYNEILLEAIDAIVVSRISEVNFDRTIVATIVDASKAKDGEYVLSDGSVQFTAHSGNDKYKENDRVNVLIPSNDFSSTEKTILGKTSANVNDVPVTYVSPLEKIVPMETNYAAGLKGGITANSEIEIFQLTNAEWIAVNESTLGYDTLCVSARFKTLLNDYDVRQGHYGLLVQLQTKNGYIHALTLDSAKDMFGNPYGYSMYLTQEQTYHLNLQDNIIGIKIDLYQMKDFNYNDGVNSELQVLPVMPYSNILVDNINVSFGYNAEQVEDNTVKISTADSLTYNNIKDASVTKKLTLTWYNKDENNKYLGFSDGHFTGQDKDNPLYEIKWYHSQNNGEWALLSDFNDATIANVEINLRWAINEYKAIVAYDGNEYSSNILSFKAETGYDSNIHDQLNMELELRNGKDGFDSYPFYGADSAVINPGDASKNREIEFVYSGALGSKLESDVLNGAIVSFYIPTISTMLNLPFGSEDEELQKESDLEGYVLYQKNFSSYNEDNKQQLKTFRYRVKEFYNPLFNNNTVILKVIDKNGFEYSAKKTFSFSSYGTSGTDYTLVIEDPINKKATLYDADYKVIKTEFEDKDWGYWPSSIGTGTPTAAAGYAVRKLTTTVKWVGKTITLEAIKGIPWYPENSNYYYQGPTTITYDSAGVNPRYYAGDIGLYDKSTNEPIVGLTWTLRYYPKNKLIKDPQTSISVQGYPQLLIDESGTKAPKLKVPNMYFDQDYYLVLVANNLNGQAQWRQPLIILQNAYSSNLLNNWNGALSVDQGNNTILSAMIGAGSKDSDNHFSGVVMGDLEKLDANGNILNSEHGLLGFHAGAQSFGFRTDGTAFIGRSGEGRIEFDGNSGVIKSAKYNGDLSQTSGSKWDLANGSLMMSGANGEYFKFNENDNGKLEMKISGADIVLTDKNTTLSSHIQMTADGIASTVASLNEKIQFYCTCGSSAGNAYKGVYLSTEDKKVFPAANEKDFPHGTTIMVKFTNGNTAKTIRLGIEGISGDETGLDNKSGLPVYLGGALDAVPTVAENTSLIFVYDTSLHGWVVSDGNTYSQIKQTAESINLSVRESYYNKGEIDIKANAISQRVEGIATDYRGTTAGTLTLQDGGYRFTVYLEGILENTPIYQAAPVFHHGTILEVKFTNASSQSGKIRLNVGHLGDEEYSGILGYPIYVNGIETSSTNTFTWSKNSIKYFRFVLISQATDPSTEFNKGYWEVCDPPYGVGQLITNTQGITGTSISRSGTGFQFNLDNASFRVGTTGNSAKTVLKVDSAGLTINGTGTFSGELIASKLTIQSGAETNVALTTDVQEVQGNLDAYKTVVANNYVTTTTLNALTINTNQINAGPLGNNITIAGLSIDNNSIYYGTWSSPKPPSVFMSKGTGYTNSYTICNRPGRDWVFGSGQNFGVTNQGLLYANEAHITGEINATSGSIGGWAVKNVSFSSLSFTNSYKGDALTTSEFKLLGNGEINITTPDNVEHLVRCIIYVRPALTYKGIYLETKYVPDEQGFEDENLIKYAYRFTSWESLCKSIY